MSVTEPAFEPEPESDPSITSIELDPQVAATQKEQRLHRLNVVLIPRFRLVGGALLALAVVLHNQLLSQTCDWPGFWFFLALFMAYNLASWWLLKKLYRRLLSHFDLGLFFLVADLFFWAQAVYLSGGEKSWLIVLLILRTADQVQTNVKRAFFFAHVTALAYLGVLAYIALVDQRPIAWPPEIGKTCLLYGANLYLTLTALAADQRRRKLTSAVRMARTLIRQLEERSAQLKAARAHAEAANEAKSQFLANMSHEIRTPMNAVVGLAEHLLASDPDPGRQQSLELLNNSAEALLRIIDDILDFSKIEAGKLIVHLEPCDLGMIVDGVRRLFEPLARSKGLTLVCDLAADVPRAILSDSVRLRQILINLISNSLKFTAEGSVELRVTSHGGGGAPGSSLRFVVTDTGQGIPSSQLANLYEPFTQGDSSLTRKHGGTGLGLPISKRLVELLGGEISVRSSPGRGTTFCFILPFRAAPSGEGRIEPPTAVPAPVPEPALPTVFGAARTVLVVEDNPINRLVILKQLASLGLETVAVEDGFKALELLSERPVDLVLMDCQMPGLDGYQTTADIRRREGDRRHTPIIAMTAHAMAGDREKCLAAGMDDYIAKPIRLQSLAETLREWLGEPPSKGGFDPVRK